MAALTCMYSACSPAPGPSSWKEAVAAAAEQEAEEVVAEAEKAYDEAKIRTRGKIVSRRRSEEEGGGAEEVWEGVVRSEIGAGVEDVWEMVGKFGDMKRWNAAVEVCELVEGEEGEVGCVRYCTGGGRWIKEKLLALHPAQRRFTYTILDSSYGFQGYVATLSILPLVPSRALVHWTFRLDPVPHVPQNKVFDLLTSVFDRMMGSLEHTILSASSPSSSSPPPPPPPLPLAN